MNKLSKILLMPQDEFEDFLLSCCGDQTPWMDWFNKNYCEQCKTIKKYNDYFKRDIEYSQCEIKGQCIYGEDFSTDKNIIKMWLNSEAE